MKKIKISTPSVIPICCKSLLIHQIHSPSHSCPVSLFHHPCLKCQTALLPYLSHNPVLHPCYTPCVRFSLASNTCHTCLFYIPVSRAFLPPLVSPSFTALSHVPLLLSYIPVSNPIIYTPVSFIPSSQHTGKINEIFYRQHGELTSISKHY